MRFGHTSRTKVLWGGGGGGGKGEGGRKGGRRGEGGNTMFVTELMLIRWNLAIFDHMSIECTCMALVSSLITKTR